jgi:DNA-directed RNA polymerase specialized sigma subunit
MRQPSPATRAFIKWKSTNDHSYRDEAVHHLKPVISSAIKTYGGSNNALKTKAWIMASEALDKYDPKRDVKLESYVHTSLKRLSRVRNERNEAIHIPENVRTDSMAIYRFMDKFRDDMGRDPSLVEISDATGLSRNRIVKAREVGTQKSFEDVTDDKGDITVGEKKSYAEVWKDYVYMDLDDVGRKIFEWSTGYGGSEVLTKKEQAERLGLSPSAVTQRTNTIIKKLEKGLVPTIQ